MTKTTKRMLLLLAVSSVGLGVGIDYEMSSVTTPSIIGLICCFVYFTMNYLDGTL